MTLMSMHVHKSPMKARMSVLLLGLEKSEDNDGVDDGADDGDEGGKRERLLAFKRGSSTVLNPREAR